ncbi:MAG: O-antigen ligase family protein [Clostridiales bacterium]|nr:O-antigen ligase family protein [Clostridiales bacterium]
MQEDLKPFVPTVLLLYFCIPRAHGSTGWADIGIWQTTPYVINLCLIGAIFLAAFLFNFIYYKQYRNFKKITFLTAGLAAFAASYLTNGLFAHDYTIKNLGYGLTFALLYYVFYLFVFCTVKWKKGESMRYLAQCMVVMGLLISVELAFLYMLNSDLHGIVPDKVYILLGWGNSNSIAFTTLLCLPFAFWLAWKEKYSLLYFLAATVMFTAIFFTYARGSLIVAGPMYLVGTVFLCFVAKRRLGIWIAAGCLLIAAIIMVFCFKDWMLDKLHIYIENGVKDRGRFRLWNLALDGFKAAPVFGSGLYFKYGVDESSLFYWAHNTILQIMATLGIFGLAAYLFHRVQTVYMCVKKPTSARLFAGLAILGILIAGMFDMVMICQNIILYYGIILAFAEKDFLCSIGKMDENGVWLNCKKEKSAEQAAAVTEEPQAPTEPQDEEQTSQATEQENM